MLVQTVDCVPFDTVHCTLAVDCIFVCVCFVTWHVSHGACTLGIPVSAHLGVRDSVCVCAYHAVQYMSYSYL